MTHRLTPPLDLEAVSALRAGDKVLISGTIFAARDAAHRRMVEALHRGEAMPIELHGQIIYYMGPTPARPGRPIGAAGPTTAGRMDPYTPELLELGLKGMIGKGRRSPVVRDAMMRHKAVYLAAVGGAGALLARHIVAAEVAAYADLGPEAILRLTVEEFPAVVINDIHGSDAYEMGQALFQVRD